MNEPRILMLLQLPPPVHGVSVLNRIVAAGACVPTAYRSAIVPIRVARTTADMGALTLGKLLRTMVLGVRYLTALILFRPDLMYFAFSPVGLNTVRDCLFVFLAKAFRVRILLHLHGVNIRAHTDRSRFFAWFFRRVFAGTRIICLSRRLAGDVAAVYDGDPFIVPNTIEYDPRETGISRAPAGTGRILYLSHVSFAKGIDVFLDALVVLHRKGYAFQAHVVGDPVGIRREDLTRNITDRGLQTHVFLHGGLFGPDKYRHFAEADLLVFPSRNEAFPLVLLEAAAWGVPVVAADVGAVRDIVHHGENGFVLSGHAPDEFAERISILLQDSSLRSEMGDAARQLFDRAFSRSLFEMTMRSIFPVALERPGTVRA